jgi:hypothetical protein
MDKTYSELIRFKTFKERLKYLSLNGNVGIETFGFNRYLNQELYNSYYWRRLRDQIILRDNGCDLGLENYEIGGKILIHHINPITERDILDRSEIIFNPENLICVSHKTHNMIHYGYDEILESLPLERNEGDTKLW